MFLNHATPPSFQRCEVTLKWLRFAAKSVAVDEFARGPPFTQVWRDGVELRTRFVGDKADPKSMSKSAVRANGDLFSQQSLPCSFNFLFISAFHHESLRALASADCFGPAGAFLLVPYCSMQLLQLATDPDA